jgi:hypothetical protein
MLQVRKTRTFEVSPGQMWERIGDWNGLHTWHPAVAATQPSETGGRELVLGDDGGSLFETETDRGDLHYSYHIDRSPLPVADYDATISVEANDGGCEVVWTAEFNAEGASDAESLATMEGIFQAGLDAL